MPKTFTPTLYAHIVVENDDQQNPYFTRTVNEALEWIASRPVGRQLLDGIVNAPVAPQLGGPVGFKVKIVRPNATATIGRPGEEGGNRAVSWNTTRAACAACYWNPNIFNTPNGYRPAFIGLAHELIHCYHYVNGLAKPTYAEEEQFTVGLAPHAGAPITENNIRQEQGLPLRTSY